ncbi:hypothetical protein GCU56_17085 [Geodermatophilus sabuli]|uniref:Uncharacterized protein n=1 Tax=Geodermatophilus sabuli TaxID=1564158 RepID=A0A7K3W5R2_9ACTN|nr:hypothetical protein [Geodermatophilus sabuli]NEK59574.1 hypothetical protein [Geodermatophilus sabuli]
MVPRHVAAVLTGLLVASGIGLLAGAFGDDRFWLRTLVFAACTVGPAYGLGWLLFVSGTVDPGPVTHPEESVEHDWWHRSAAGAFLDLLSVAGLGAAALAVTGLEVAATTVLMALLVLGFADVAVRFTVLSRRDA